jgi:hypothetical protein
MLPNGDVFMIPNYMDYGVVYRPSTAGIASVTIATTTDGVYNGLCLMNDGRCASTRKDASGTWLVIWDFGFKTSFDPIVRDSPYMRR